MKLLVTGGCGFIGTNFILSALGILPNAEPWPEIERIVNLDKLTYAADIRPFQPLERDLRYHFVTGDIQDADLVTELLVRQELDAVLHLAAETHVDRSIREPESFVRTNCLGTFRLLNACCQHWRGLPADRAAQFRFVHVSTDEVFGSLGLGDRPFDELSHYAPNSPYSASKAGADHFVRAYVKTFGFPAILTHASNNYGPHQFPEKLIPFMIERGLGGENLPIYGRGLNVRDWLHVSDHCEALRLVLSKGVIGESYCIGAACERTNTEVVNAVCDCLDTLVHHETRISHRSLKAYVSDRPGHDFRYAIDSAKIRSELGWAPCRTFEEALLETVRWYVARAGR